MIDVKIVKWLMKEKGLNVNQMAERMKVTPQTVRRFLNADDHLNYSVGMLFKMARALEVSISEIMHEDCKTLPDTE